MQPSHARCQVAGPAAGTAAHIEPFGIWRQLLPWKNGIVDTKHQPAFAVGHALLIEALLLITKVGDGSGAEDGLEH